MSGPANIVNTLKSKIKETADELEKYEGISEETRAKYNSERKAREEIEAEVLSLNRKIKLMEDNMKRHEDRWEPAQHTAWANSRKTNIYLLSRKLSFLDSWLGRPSLPVG